MQSVGLTHCRYKSENDDESYLLPKQNNNQSTTVVVFQTRVLEREKRISRNLFSEMYINRRDFCTFPLL